MPERPSIIDECIRNALKSADDKGKLDLVAVVTGLPLDRLADIVDGGKPDQREQIILSTYLD